MSVLLVGGNFGEAPRSSSVVDKIWNEFSYYDNSKLINGGLLEELPTNIGSDLTIWMPNISNENLKQYPIKGIGGVLIVSKVIREGYTMIDAIERIFKMHGNAVIAIIKENKFRFKLIDALGNVWYNGFEIVELCQNIKSFYAFTKSAVRCRTNKITLNVKIPKSFFVDELISINKSLADHIQTSCGERFFGNLSTRCSKLFPSVRNVGIYVSPRNMNKEYITSEDMVYCEIGSGTDINYVGNFKPSVDAPIQLKVYEFKPQINFMIHGHAFVDGAIETEHYYLCGDLREAPDTIKIIGENNFGAINLKNHGFLLYSDTLENLKELIKELKFSYRRDE